MLGPRVTVPLFLVLTRVLTSVTSLPPGPSVRGAIRSPGPGSAVPPSCEEGDRSAGQKLVRWAACRSLWPEQHRHTWPWGAQHGTLALRGGREVRVGGREVCLPPALPCWRFCCLSCARAPPRRRDVQRLSKVTVQRRHLPSQSRRPHGHPKEAERRAVASGMPTLQLAKQVMPHSVHRGQRCGVH